MKIKEIYVEAKKSRSFQTYTAGLTITIEDKDDPDEVILLAQAKCRKAVQEQIKLDSL